MPPPKISVIVPVYNTENYLRQCLDSLVHQTLRDIEIIVVNDGSTDGSLNIAQEYEQQHPNLFVISQDNQGLSAARNVGMAHATGDYIGFLDSDDWASLDMFQALYERAIKDGSDLVIGNAKVFWEDLHSIEHFFDRELWAGLPAQCKEGPFRIEDAPHVFLLEPAAWKRLYRRTFLTRLGFQFPNGLIFEDVPAHFELLLRAKAISLLDKPVCVYRMGRPGKITARRDRTVFQVFDVFALAQQSLRASGANDLAWALYLKFQMRFCSWLFLQVPKNHRAEFFRDWTAQCRRVPAGAFRRYGEIVTGVRERFASDCLRKGRFVWFSRLADDRITLPMKAYAALRYQPTNHICQLSRTFVRRLRDFAAGLLPMPYRASLGRMHAIGQDMASLRHALLWELSALRQSVAELAHSREQQRAGHERSDAYTLRRFKLDGREFVFADEIAGNALWEMFDRMLRNYYLHDSIVLRPGDSVVDIGSHVGVFAICVAKMNPSVTVYAVESDARNYRNLLRNIRLNGVQNIVPLRYAITERGGTARIFTRPSYSGNVTLSEEVAADYGDVRSAKVPAITLAELFDKCNIERCRMMKVTAEGHETETLSTIVTEHPRVDYLCGEVSAARVDTGGLRITSSRAARRSFWRIKGVSNVITTDGPIHYAVSVVVPVYNVERYLSRCVDSLVSQTLPNMQIILVNDGSKDGSGEIIRDYARRYPQIFCIDKANGGCASARNAGLKAAQGEYVGFVDSDDWVDSSMFKKLYDKAVDCSADVVQCGLVKYYEQEDRSDPVNEDALACLVERAGNRMERSRDLLCLQPTMWRRIYRRTMLEQNSIAFPQDVRMFDDLPFQFMALACCQTIAIVNEPLYYYRLQRPGQDVGVTDQRLFVTFRLFEIIREFITRRDCPEIQPYFEKLQLVSHAWILQQIDSSWRQDYLKRAASCLGTDYAGQLRALARAA